MSVLMAWGQHGFSISGPSYESLEHSTEGRQDQVDLIARAPAYEFNGPGPETITLTGTLYPLLFDGFSTLDALRAAVRGGTRAMLVSGFGRVFGRYAATKASRTETMATADGKPQKIEFTLELVRV